MGVLRGMKARVPGNIATKETYSGEFEQQTAESLTEEDQAEERRLPKGIRIEPVRKGKKNQNFQIKVPEQIREELNALKIITKTRFDYELIGLLIDSYSRNELSPTQRRKFKVMTSEEEI